jgi:hypothetical protein
MARSRAVEQHLAAGRSLQAEHRAAERGLAAAGFADEAQRPAPGCSVKLTPSTALTWATTRRSSPPRTGKVLLQVAALPAAGRSLAGLAEGLTMG